MYIEERWLAYDHCYDDRGDRSAPKEMIGLIVAIIWIGVIHEMHHAPGVIKNRLKSIATELAVCTGISVLTVIMVSTLLSVIVKDGIATFFNLLNRALKWIKPNIGEDASVRRPAFLNEGFHDPFFDENVHQPLPRNLNHHLIDAKRCGA